MAPETWARAARVSMAASRSPRPVQTTRRYCQGCGADEGGAGSQKAFRYGLGEETMDVPMGQVLKEEDTEMRSRL